MNFWGIFGNVFLDMFFLKWPKIKGIDRSSCEVVDGLKPLKKTLPNSTFGSANTSLVLGDRYNFLTNVAGKQHSIIVYIRVTYILLLWIHI